MTQQNKICAEEYVVKRGDSFYLIAHKRTPSGPAGRQPGHSSRQIDGRRHSVHSP